MKKNYLLSLLISLLTTVVFSQACTVPGNVSVVNITSNSAVINWTTSNETQWEVYITPSGTTPPNSNTVGTIVTSTPYVVTNLIGCTTYNAYIKAVCSPTQSSNWSASISFNTLMEYNSVVPDMQACSYVNTGAATFNLETQTSILLNGLNPNQYFVNYYLTYADASNPNSTFILPLLYNNTTSSDVIYARIQGPEWECFTVVHFRLIVNPSPASLLSPVNYMCFDSTTNTLTPYILDTQLSNMAYSFQWSLNGVPIAGATENTYTATTTGIYDVLITDIVNGCQTTATTTLSTASTPTMTADIENQTITINVAGPGNFQYLIDNEPAQLSNIFENVALGTHTIQVIPTNSSCPPFYLTITVTTPSSPLGQTTQTFTQGQTLANLVITGQNIQWYATPGTAGLTSTTETPLPMSTVLAHNTTYYASQTINGIESPDRLAVTTMMVLNNDDFTFKKLAYYPNPISNNLTISNQETISAITISNLLGQTVVDKKINGNQYEVDFSGLSKGIYLVKVTVNNQSKTFKVIKE